MVMRVYESKMCMTVVDLLDDAISGIQKPSQQVGAFNSFFPGLTRTVAERISTFPSLSQLFSIAPLTRAWHVRMCVSNLQIYSYVCITYIWAFRKWDTVTLLPFIS